MKTRVDGNRDPREKLRRARDRETANRFQTIKLFSDGHLRRFLLSWDVLAEAGFGAIMVLIGSFDNRCGAGTRRYSEEL
jgi:hypothetical protein